MGEIHSTATSAQCDACEACREVDLARFVALFKESSTGSDKKKTPRVSLSTKDFTGF
jgi:hypothetical protein